MKNDLYVSDLSAVAWRKSSFSATDNCLEVAAVAGGVALRDSKNPTRGPLLFTDGEWRAFVRGTRAGEFS